VISFHSHCGRIELVVSLVQRLFELFQKIRRSSTNIHRQPGRVDSAPTKPRTRLGPLPAVILRTFATAHLRSRCLECLNAQVTNVTYNAFIPLVACRVLVRNTCPIPEAIAMTTARMGSTKGYIVVGVDGSESSKAALRWAAKLAPVIDCTVEAVIAWNSPVIVWEVLSKGFPNPSGLDEIDSDEKIPIRMQPDVDAMRELEETINDVFGLDRPVGLVTFALQGHPAEVLLEESKKSEMLIVGSRGHGGFAGLRIGSVSSACIERATCPVLVVHGEHNETVVPSSRLKELSLT
jgi:nucleotide-binding universal stress UspA family protein